MENPIDFPDLEAFGNNNYSRELDDLNDVLDWIQNHFKNNAFVDSNSICLVGHSRGGGISVLKASTDSRITKLITLASVSDFGSRFGTNDEVKEWKEKGVKYVVNGRTKQEMPHYYQFYKDFKANEDKLHIETAAKAISIPFLIIHGNKDTSVSINAAHDLHSWNPKSKLDIINDADHVFNTRHPWEQNNLSSELLRVVDSIVDFNRT